jgi:hypothetical protein
VQAGRVPSPTRSARPKKILSLVVIPQHQFSSPISEATNLPHELRCIRAGFGPGSICRAIASSLLSQYCFLIRSTSGMPICIQSHHQISSAVRVTLVHETIISRPCVSGYHSSSRRPVVHIPSHFVIFFALLLHLRVTFVHATIHFEL